MKQLAWHFDFHSHQRVRIGHNPDPEGIADALADAGVEEIISFAKCHTGFSYYPTDIGVPHPKLKGDPFGDVVRACREREVQVLAYVSFGIDGEMGRRHADWRQWFSPTEPETNEDGFISVCPFTPYMDDSFLPQVEELIEQYQPAGFFFDTMGAFMPCYCDACRAAYDEAEGEIPTELDSKAGATYGSWRHQRALDLIARVGEVIHDRLPDAEIGFNQIGTPPFPEALPESISRLTLDFATFNAQSRQASLCASYGATASREADIMPTRFNQGWGDWSAAPDLSLEQVAAPVLAYRQRLYMGDRLHPANRLTDGTREALTQLSRLWQNMNQALPDEAVPFTPDTVVLHSASAVYGGDLRHFAIDPRSRLAPLAGAHRLLMDAGRNLAIAADCYLDDWLQPDRLLIVPDLPAMSKTTAERLKAFAEDGGEILVTGCIPQVDGKPLDWLGVEDTDDLWQDHLWLPWPATDDHPVLVRGDSHVLQPNGAEAVLYPRAPYDLIHGASMGWGINPPADEEAQHPVMTRATVGSGAAWFLGCPIFTDYARGLNLQQKRWLEEMLRLVQPRPLQRLISPHGSVELVPYADDRTSWSVLLNHGGEEFAPYGEAPWPRTVGPLPPYDVTLVVRDPQMRRPKGVTLGGQPADWERLDDEVHVEVRLDRVWHVVKIAWES